MKPNKILFTRYIQVILFAGLLVLILHSCTRKFDDYNTDPNAATDEMMKYDYRYIGSFITQMQQNIFPCGQGPVGDENKYVNSYQLSQNLTGDIYAGYMGATNTWYSNVNSTTYALVPTWYGENFKNTFLYVLSAWKNIKQRAETDMPSAYALAQILKVEAVHRTTDIYGPLPYFDFGKSSKATRYNPQDSIYYSMFNDLDSAIAVLTQFVHATPSSKPMAKFDLVYGGDYRQWVKFANSLKLRLAIRIVYANPTLAKQKAEEAVNHEIGVLTGNNDNAYIKSGNGVLIPNPLKVICYDYNDVRMGATMESYLQGYKDPREAVYFNKSTLSNPADYHGVRTGINVTTAYQNNSTLNISSTTPVLWMAAAEMYFLRAEGAVRGWNMGGTAQDLYNTGIQTSFDQAGVGSAATYIANNTSKPAAYRDWVSSGNSINAGDVKLDTITIAWRESATLDNKLSRIITQKWLAMYPDGQEAWSEFRRTGYPKVFPVQVNNSGSVISTTTQIRRLPFPQSEYQANAAAVSYAVGNLLGGADNGNTKLWWDKK